MKFNFDMEKEKQIYKERISTVILLMIVWVCCLAYGIIFKSMPFLALTLITSPLVLIGYYLVSGDFHYLHIIKITEDLGKLPKRNKKDD